MKLAELFEDRRVTQYQPLEHIAQQDPSGIPTQTTVDPEKTKHIRLAKASKKTRHERIRRRWRTVRDMKKDLDSTGADIKTDNTDLTGSGAHSIMNGPYTY